MAAEKILSAEAEVMFREGVGLVFSRWSALQMAVDNEWGGRNSRAKAEQLAADVFSWFTQAKPNEVRFAEDLEELLIEGISSLNVVADDGSIEEVAEELMYLHEDCEKGDFKPIEDHRKASRDRVPLPHVRVENENDNSDDDNNESDDPMVDAPDAQSNLNPVNMAANKPTAKPVAAAEDGWEVVAPRRNRERVMEEAAHAQLEKLPPAVEEA